MNSESKVYQIRFNTESKSEVDRWRLIENGNEMLVRHILIDGRTYTTKDWVDEIGDWKWHISCVGVCEIKNNIAHIKTDKDDFVIADHLASHVFTCNITHNLRENFLCLLVSGGHSIIYDVKNINNLMFTNLFKLNKNF